MHIATRLQATELERQGLIRKHKKLLAQIALLSPEEEVVVTPDFDKGEVATDLHEEIARLVQRVVPNSCCVRTDKNYIIIQRIPKDYET